jgi:predicted RNA binding protein YcfA (HicA-like mRNA interferase family)
MVTTPDPSVAIIGHAATNRVTPYEPCGKYRLAKQARACYGGWTARMTSRDVIRRLEAHGWRLKKVTGSHHHFIHPTRHEKVTVKHPAKDFKIGTLKSIERQSGVSLTSSAR